jgi:hypothetical protein
MPLEVWGPEEKVRTCMTTGYKASCSRMSGLEDSVNELQHSGKDKQSKNGTCKTSETPLKDQTYKSLT